MNVSRLLVCMAAAAGASFGASAFAAFPPVSLTLDAAGPCNASGAISVAVKYHVTGTSGAAGAQFFLKFDPALTASTTVTPGAGLTLIYSSVNNTGHTIAGAVGVQANGQVFADGDTIATVTFTDSATICHQAGLVAFDGMHSPPNTVTDGLAQAITLTVSDLGVLTLHDTTAPVINGGNALPVVTQGTDANTCSASLGSLVNFEGSPSGYQLLADVNGSTTLSTAQAFSATQSARLFLPSGSADFAKVQAPLSGMTLGNASGMFQTYVTPGSAPDLAPYMYFKVDANQNGIDDFDGSPTGDALVIVFISGAQSIPQGRWFTQGINGTTNIHVIGNRTGLTSGQFASTNGGGLLSALRNTTFSGGLKWGDLHLNAVRVGAGEWPGAGQFEAFVDDILVTRNLELPPSVLDNCDPAPVLRVARGDAQPMDALFPSGTTTLTWTSTDQCGNSSSVNQSVVVNDTQAPAIVACAPDITVNADAGTCSATFTYTNTFDSAVTLSNTRAPNAFYLDRYPPAGFASAAGPGGNVLKHSISSADSFAHRPGGFQANFYNTQGRAFDVDMPIGETLGIDLYVDVSWLSGTVARRADMWAVGIDKANSGSPADYGIIGFSSSNSASDASGAEVPGVGPARWRVYDNAAAWTVVGPVPTAGWHRLEITLGTTTKTYKLDGVPVLTNSNYGSVRYSSVLLQAYNFGFSGGPDGDSYDVYWDNFLHGPQGPVYTDNCCVASVTATRSDALSLYQPFPTGNTTVTWTVTDCAANSTSCNQIVHVNPFNTLAATVELAGTSSNPANAPFTRCITFNLYGSGPCALATTVTKDITFTNGIASNAIGSALIDVPCGSGPYTGITATDTHHTLRRLGVLSVSSPDYVSSFTAARALQGGNINNDAFIDILDFGGYIGQFGTNPGASTSCAGGLNADFSGNGSVGIEDFNFISFGFLNFRDADPCGVALVGESPITDVAVADLVATGLRSYALADFNLDGRLNSADITYVSQHGLPRCAADFNDDQATDVSDIFAFLGAWFADHPKADLNGNNHADVQDIFQFLEVWFQGC